MKVTVQLDTKTIRETSPPQALISESQVNTGASLSPRESSEDSFDLVSSSNVSADEVKDEDGGGDSDWE